MQEIKFRVWDKERQTRLMQYPLLRDFGWLGESCLADPKRYVVMQFTGLHDRNGKEIYEGDIVRLCWGINDEMIYAEIVYRPGGFWFEEIGIDQGRRTDCNWHFYSDEIEVVGNVFENPELIKQ